MKEKRLSKRSFVRGVGVVALAVAIGHFPSVLQAASKEIVIGAIQPLTGITAEGGQMATWGLELSDRFTDQRKTWTIEL